MKFGKRDGRGIGDWPVYRLVVESIKPNISIREIELNGGNQ
jgi:hypothetical protein